jgi:two-component system sensor kinase FixL
VHTSLADDLPKISGNIVQLQQVLINLTHNAVDAMKHAIDRDKGICIVTRRLEDGRAQMRVQDSGPGVPKKLIGSIFHPFVTTKREGIGVGLAISQTIVRAHQGELKHECNPDGGATFIVTLPAEDKADG